MESLVITTAILIFLIIFMFRKQIRKIHFKNTAIGELLITLNRQEKIIKPENEKIVGRTSAEEIWALYDLSEKRISGYVKDLNPIQKYIYSEMLKDNLVKKDQSRIFLTDLGRQILALAKKIDL